MFDILCVVGFALAIVNIGFLIWFERRERLRPQGSEAAASMPTSRRKPRVVAITEAREVEIEEGRSDR